MTNKDGMYRLLQQHLDKQAVGFPATRSGADIRFLKRLFTPDEAKIALHLSYKPTQLRQIVASSPRLASLSSFCARIAKSRQGRKVSPKADRRSGRSLGAAPEFSAEQTEQLLDSMFMKGAIGWKEKDSISHWYVMPLVIGMYEAQDGNPTPEFLDDASAYMKTMSYGKAFLAVKPSQMRTIPIHKSIPVEHHVATYDQIRAIIQTARGPFVVLKCICREAAAIRNKPCKKISRLETCLGFGDMAAMVLRRKHGREVSRDEALAILQQNEDDGLVLQPANAQKPEFVCSCCGCCCGMLSFQKFLPHPLDFWTSNFYAEVDTEACSRCGKCLSRCQVKAVTLTGPSGRARINLSRCIGCGLCIPTCPSNAVRLKKKEPETIPPENEEDLYDKVMANKKGVWGQFCMFLKIALGRIFHENT